MWSRNRFPFCAGSLTDAVAELRQTHAEILEANKTGGSLDGDSKPWVDGIYEPFCCLFSHDVSSAFFTYQLSLIRFTDSFGQQTCVHSSLFTGAQGNL